MLFVIVAMLGISFAMSTREQRTAAARAVARYNWPLGIAAALIWAFLLFPLWWPG